MDLKLKGKTAVITGASQGIGRAIVNELLSEGAQVLAIARDESLLAALKEDAGRKNGLVPVTLAQDLMVGDAAQIIADTAFSVFGSVDILINNAGRSRPLPPTGDSAAWNESMILEFERPRQLTERFLDHFTEKRSGVVLNVVSDYELRSINASAVAKAALIAWSKGLADQVARYGVRVNCLQPGLIDTQNTRRLFSDDDRKEFSQREIPFGEFGMPEDMADMAVFLVSPRARYVTGSVAVVDGGLRRYPF